MSLLIPNLLTGAVFYGFILAIVVILSLLSRSSILRENASWMLLDWTMGNAMLFVADRAIAPGLMSALDLAVMVGLYQNAQSNTAARNIVNLYGLGLFVTFIAYITHSEGSWVHLGAMNIIFMFQCGVQGHASYAGVVDRVRDIMGITNSWTGFAAVSSRQGQRKV